MKLFSDEDLYLSKLSDKGDPLERLNKIIDWESFRPVLQRIFRLGQKDRRKGGRPRYDVVMMFKLLLLQRYNNLSDDAMEYQLLDRLSFRRFLGLEDKNIPDAKTIWLFKENLAQNGKANQLFETFELTLADEGLLVHRGQIVDATFTEAPKPHNKKEENDQIKSGEIPKDWSENKRRQKDTDARWTIKGNERHFGYKNHVCIDAGSKLIKNYQVTPANVHDSQVCGVLMDKKEIAFADSAYQSQAVPQGVTLFTCLKNTRSQSLDKEAKLFNRILSKTRVRIEHVFGFIENSMKGSKLRSIGFVRAVLQTDLTNLTYNLFRYEQIKRLNLYIRG
jgi:IS5 family transposase